MAKEHEIALRAVQRDTTGVPRCPDWRLLSAEDAGLIKFRTWPSGQWQITAKGLEYLRDDVED